MIVGIDLGTSTSEIAILRDGKPQILRDIDGSSYGFLPSVVAIDSDGRLAIGEGAAKVLTVRPDAAAAEIKRLMGTDSRVQLGADSYRPEEIAAFILKHLKKEAERTLGELVTEVIITVPAYFTAVQRRATHEAAELAGLVVRRLINEPTAAALAYGIERPGVEEKILVYDLGGGTLDVTVLDLSEGVLDVLASTGNAALGGKDFDDRLMRYLRDACRRETGVDLTVSPTLQARLKSVAKRAKEDLSSNDRASVVLDNLDLAADGTPIHWEHIVAREAFDAQVRELVLSTRTQLDEALAVKRLSPGDITTVILVGGSTRVPLVRDFVSEYFGGRVLRTEVHPDEAVALGAAVLGGIEAQSIDASRLVVTDVAPWTLGVAILRTKDGQRVAGVFDPLILKQTTIPRTVARRYQTTDDWQQAVHVQVYQGDAPRCRDNIFVGDFHLEDITQVPAGAPIDIEFSYNLSGELEVSARALGREARVVMRLSAAHLGPVEKAAARARVNKRWSVRRSSAADGERPSVEGGNETAAAVGESWRSAPLYAKVEVLVQHAERELTRLEADPRARLEALLAELRVAVTAGDQGGMGAAEQAITDLLFNLS